MCKKYLFKNIFIVTGVIFLDQLSKYLILQKLNWHETLTLFNLNNNSLGLNLFLTYNTGAAFGFLHKYSGWQNYLFLMIGCSVAIYIIYLLINNKITNTLEKLACLLVLSGSIGNILDRLMYGYVIDFIDIYVKNFHWYTFNVADSAICIAMLLFFISCFPQKNPIKI